MLEATRGAAIMPDVPQSGWPGRVAVAVVRVDPPEVFVAEDPEVLGRVLAVKVVARAAASDLPAKTVRDIRAALLDERWGDAVATWIDATGVVVDAYPDDDLWTDARLDADQTSMEIRLAPVFDLADPEDDPAGG